MPDATCLFRPLCTAHTEIACRPAQQPRMRKAIERCVSRNCFAVFRDLLAGRDVREPEISSEKGSDSAPSLSPDRLLAARHDHPDATGPVVDWEDESA